MLAAPFFMVGTLISAGFTPSPGAGIWTGAELLGAGEVFSLGLEARFLFPSRAIEDPSGRPFDLSAFVLALVPCVRWSWILGCAVGDFSLLYAGTGLAPDRRSPSAIGGVGPRLALQLPLSDFSQRLGLRIFADLRFSPNLNGGDPTFRTDRFEFKHGLVSGMFGIALTLNWVPGR
jgi:hypothetical protein